MLPVKSPALGAAKTWADVRSCLIAEQGLGDTMQFIRFAPLVKARRAHVVVACPKALIRLVARCPGVDRVVDWKSTLPDCDVHASLLSLPAILGNKPGEPARRSLSVGRRGHHREMAAEHSTEPFADTTPMARRVKRRALKIGIAWQGNRDHKGDRWRSFPLAHFARLAEVPGVQLISLQKGYGTEQLAAIEGKFSVARLARRMDGQEDRRDFLDTAAVMSQLDLVITPRFVAGTSGRRFGCPGMGPDVDRGRMALAARPR